MSNPSNSVEISGQVVGVYPSKSNNMPGGYQVLYRTGFLRDGKVQITEAKVFVNTAGALPNENDVVTVSGFLNVYNSRDKATGSYNTRVSITETGRVFVRKGEPIQKQSRGGNSGGYQNNRRGGYNSQQSRQDEPQVETPSREVIPF